MKHKTIIKADDYIDYNKRIRNNKILDKRIMLDLFSLQIKEMADYLSMDTLDFLDRVRKNVNWV